MPAVIDRLMKEHQLILEVLGSLESFVMQAREAEAADAEAARRYVRFVRGYADRFHHGKEEDMLFVRMGEHGFPTEAGPIAVMLQEHDMGRAHVGGMAAAAEGRTAITGPELADFARHAFDFINLLRNHIAKEDRILYPMAARMLPPDALDALEAEARAHDEGGFPADERDALLAIARDLKAAWPPDPERMAFAMSGDPQLS